MKKIAILLVASAILFNSCGTICGGKITDCQKQGPGRQIRPAALIFDLLTFPIIGLVVDFADGAMYVPCRNGGSNAPPRHYN